MTFVGLIGQMFVGGLKAIAPLLVFALVANALSQSRDGQKSNMKIVIFLYLLATFSAALVAVLSSYIFPVSLTNLLYNICRFEQIKRLGLPS